MPMPPPRQPRWPIQYSLPPIRKSPPLLSGFIGALGIAIAVAIWVLLSGHAHVNFAAGAGQGGGSLPTVSISGAIPCQVDNGPSVNLTADRLSTCTAAKAYAKAKLVQEYGATEGAVEFGCLDNMWYRESGWSAYAVNPSSGAYGIAQTIPGIHQNEPPHDQWQPQVDWGLGYINHGSGNFHSPCQAWAFWQRTDPRPYPGHWY